MNLSELINLYRARLSLPPASSSESLAALEVVLTENTAAAREILTALRSAAASSCGGLMQSLSAAQTEFCIKLASGCLRIYICTARKGGFETIIPVFIAPDDRLVCAELYDICTEQMKIRNKMYIPEPVEREAPDRSRLMFLIRQYLDLQSARALKAQAAGNQFNRLFGSRG